MSSTVFKLGEHVLIGVVYIPPECTSYSSQEASNDIYFDIRYFARLYEYISSAGNCNARIAELNDFSLFTEKYFLNEDTYLLEKCTSFLTYSNLPLKKHGLDKGQNKSGKLLISLCKRQRFFVMNGRVGNIRYRGELTYRNASAVDYFICTPDFIKCIDVFIVLDVTQNKFC